MCSISATQMLFTWQNRLKKSIRIDKFDDWRKIDEQISTREFQIQTDRFRQAFGDVNTQQSEIRANRASVYFHLVDRKFLKFSIRNFSSDPREFSDHFEQVLPSWYIGNVVQSIGSH